MKSIRARWFTACSVAIILFAAILIAPKATRSEPPAGKSTDAEFSPYVSKTGEISKPTDYRDRFLHLGSWAVATKENGPVVEIHNVYTPAKVIEAYRRDGKFPDGATLVKEITNVSADNLTTGRSSWSTQTKVWFVMVKDSKGRFPDNPLWGDGWGWALFKADAPAKNTATDYTADCKTCHIPARQDDWIYVRGYPVLGKHASPR